MSNEQVQIAIVGMTGSGKTVLISTLAMKMSQMADKGVFLAPIGENRRQTLRYVQQNWQTLNDGHWPPSTPAGELINLQWELTTRENAAIVRFADCAGQDVHAIFHTEHFRASRLPNDLREVYAYLNQANILLFLVNMEDLLGRNRSQSVENALDLDQMIHVLSQKTDIPRRTAVVFSQFDKYKPEVDQRYGGNLLEYMRTNLPQLHGQYVRNQNFAILAVSAVNQTQLVVEHGEAKLVPVPGFSSFNLDSLIQWIATGVDEIAVKLEKRRPVSGQREDSQENPHYSSNDSRNDLTLDWINRDLPGGGQTPLANSYPYQYREENKEKQWGRLGCITICLFYITMFLLGVLIAAITE